MRREIRELKFKGSNKTFIIESYGNFRELKEVSSSRKENFGGSDSSKHDRSFTGCDSLEDAYDKLMYGWEDKEKVKKIEQKVKELKKVMNVERVGFRNDVIGFAPVVPNAIKGIPQSMINSVKQPKRAKVVNIVVNPSYSGGTSISSILKWGAKLVAKIHQLEMSGYRCRLEYCTDFIASDGTSKFHLLRVLMKNENQPLDIKRIMFPIAHAGMLRAVAFDWYERLPDAQRISGYGIPLNKQNKDLQKFVEDVINESNNGYYVHYGDNIEERLGGLK